MGLAQCFSGRSGVGIYLRDSRQWADLGSSGYMVVLWDWRLAWRLVLWLLYVCFLVLRTLMRAQARALFDAPVGIFAFI